MTRILVVIFAILALPSWSAPISVKSGEHSDFTRLVVYLPRDREWTLLEEDGFSILNVDAWSDGFDTKEVFDRIDTQRLRSITSTDGRLVLSLSCDCIVIATELEQGFLTLDIREAEIRRPTQRPGTGEKVETTELIDLPKPLAIVAEPLDWPVVFEPEVEEPILDRILQNSNASPVSDFAAGLGRELSRSATLNYLQPSGFELSDSVRVGTKTQSELLAELGQRAKFINAGNDTSDPKLEPANTCPAPSRFAVSTWGGPEPFSAQLGELRKNLYSEFDAIDPDASRHLMRFYVHYGLVEELLDVIETFPNSPDFDLLTSLGRTVAGEPKSQDNTVGYFHCGGETGFWSFISGDWPDDVTQADVEELVSVYQKLPDTLKVITSDRLVRSFDQLGLDVASGVIRSALIRSESSDPEAPNAPTLTSDLKAMPQDQLLKLVEMNDELSADALAYFMENAILNGTEIPPGTLDLVGAYIHQLTGQQIAKRLMSSQILGLALSDEIPKALDLVLVSDDDYLNPENTITRLAKITLDAAQPFEVSQLVWRLKNAEKLSAVSEETRIELAKYFETQGQPQLALILLDEIENTSSTREIFAQTLAKDGRHDDAIDLVSKDAVEGIGSRLSEVLVIQDPQHAWSLRNDLSGIAAEQVAWISQNWDDVAEEGPRKDVSNLLSQSREKQTVSGKPIQNAQMIYSDSQESRRVLNELLN